MGRESFHQLLQRYLDGECTPAEERLVEHWYHMLEGDGPYEIDPANMEALEDALWAKIQAQVEVPAAGDPGRQPLLRKTIIRYAAVAAILALFITAGIVAYYRVICYPVEPSFVAGAAADSNMVVVSNDTDHRMDIILSDQSLVELYPGARLQYPKQFGSHSREVRLTGDAFFSVAANAENPFWVFHEGMITKVLGTKFKITAPRGNTKGEVIVYSGKVDVFYNVGRRNMMRRLLSAPEKASVTTNQRAVLLAKSLEETVTENPLPISGRAEAIRNETFRDIPMTVLAGTLSELYGLDVEADTTLSETTFTGDISGIGLFKQLDIICTVTHTRYEVVGTTIYLKQKPR